MNMSVIKRLVLVAFIFGFTPTFLNANEQAIQSGKFQYELIQRDSQMPKFGDCWTNSLKELQKGCQSLTDELQSRMALRFANCFLAQAGQKTYPCDVSEKMSDCLTGVDTNAFSAYSNFFTVSLYISAISRNFCNVEVLEFCIIMNNFSLIIVFILLMKQNIREMAQFHSNFFL